jgi:methionyl-tRNA formyltransferase
MPPLTIVFAGTPAFAARHLSAILDTSHNVVAVYTQPDRRSGRGKKLVPSAVKQLAIERGIEVRQPPSLKGEQQQRELADLNADLMIVVAYGLILPESILQTPQFGCVNVHASLLPRWRGAAPIERAILAGDSESGVTIMLLDAGLDTGAILASKSVVIAEDETRLSLENKLAQVGTVALTESLGDFSNLRSLATVQDDSLSTYADKVLKDEARIDWNNSAQVIDRQIRAGIGRYPAFTFAGGERFRLLEGQIDTLASSNSPGTIVSIDPSGMRIACGRHTIVVKRLQAPGKSAVSIADFVNSNQKILAQGVVFSDSEAGNQ